MRVNINSEVRKDLVNDYRSECLDNSANYIIDELKEDILLNVSSMAMDYDFSAKEADAIAEVLCDKITKEVLKTALNKLERKGV